MRNGSNNKKEKRLGRRVAVELLDTDVERLDRYKTAANIYHYGPALRKLALDQLDQLEGKKAKAHA